MIRPTYLKIRKKLKQHFHEIAKTKKTSKSIALGFAIGTFVNVLFTPGFNAPLTLLIMVISERINKYSLLSALAFWNPLTMPIVYSLSYFIGDIIFKSQPSMQYGGPMATMLLNFTRRYLVGNIIVAITFSIASYFILKWVIDSYRNIKKEIEEIKIPKEE